MERSRLSRIRDSCRRHRRRHLWNADGTAAVRSCPHIDPALHARYDATMHAVNYLWAEAINRRAGSVLSETTFGGRERYHRSDIFNEFIRPQGADSILLMTLTEPTSPAKGILTIGRNRKREPFGAPDLADAAALCRALARTIAATGAAWRIWGQSPALEEIGLLVTPDCRLLSRDARIGNLVKSGLLGVSHGFLESKWLPGLPQAVADACRTLDDWPPPLSTSLGPVTVGGGCFRVDVTPGGASAPGAALVTIRAELTGDPRGRFARRFGLTTREAEVAACLAAGMTLPEAANHLGIELTTARTHLGRLFDKTGTRSQLALGLLAARELRVLAG